MRGRASPLAASLTLAACTVVHSTVPPISSGGAAIVEPSLKTHAIIGFSVDAPTRATAAGQGVNTTILYGGSPAPGSALEKALESNGISVIDAGVSGILFYWECHRTHTIKPPPKSYSHNPYCHTDEDPHIKSRQIVLSDVGEILKRDAKRPYVVGYWVLDDWAWWDPGSARELLKEVHALIVKETPALPAICGFGREWPRRGGSIGIQGPPRTTLTAGATWWAGTTTRLLDGAIPQRADTSTGR